jgi:hypothetical protein
MTQRPITVAALAAPVLLLLGATAQAASIDFQTIPGVDGDTVASPIVIGGYTITTVATNDVLTNEVVILKKTGNGGLGVGAPGGTSARYLIANKDTSGTTNETLSLIFNTTINAASIQLNGLSFSTSTSNNSVTVTWGTGLTAGASQTGSQTLTADGNLFHSTGVDSWSLLGATGLDWIKVTPNQPVSASATTSLYWKGLDVTTAAVVPVPAAAWLFGSGVALLGWARRKTA